MAVHTAGGSDGSAARLHDEFGDRLGTPLWRHVLLDHRRQGLQQASVDSDGPKTQVCTRFVPLNSTFAPEEDPLELH